MHVAGQVCSKLLAMLNQTEEDRGYCAMRLAMRRNASHDMKSDT